MFKNKPMTPEKKKRNGFPLITEWKSHPFNEQFRKRDVQMFPLLQGKEKKDTNDLHILRFEHM